MKQDWLGTANELAVFVSCSRKQLGAGETGVASRERTRASDSLLFFNQLLRQRAARSKAS